jgi:hypothetical protein
VGPDGRLKHISPGCPDKHKITEIQALAKNMFSRVPFSMYCFAKEAGDVDENPSFAYSNWLANG